MSTATEETGARLRHILAPALVVVAWLAFALPQTAIMLTAGRGFSPVGEGGAPDSRAVTLLTTACNAVLLLACAAAVVLSWRRIEWRRWPLPAVLLAPWVYLVVADTLRDQRPVLPVVLYPALVVALWCVQPGRSAVRALAWTTVATAAASICAGLAMPSLARFADYSAADLAKDGPLGILAGLLPSGNNLGVALAVGLPSVLVLRRWWRVAALVLVTVALAWSYSRTAWAVALVVAVGALALRWAPTARRALLGVAGVLLIGVVQVGVALVAREPTAFANRARYWIAGRDAFGQSPWVGHGSMYYERNAATAPGLGEYAYHAHNQAVQTLVTGGVVLAILYLALTAVALWRAWHATIGGATWPVLTLAAIAAAGIAEVPFGVVDRQTYWPSVVVPLCVAILGAWRTAPAPLAERSDSSGTLARA